MAAKSLATLPLVVIVGPTASGKTALSIQIAERYNGEIICADSRTIYKGMDIGTAKPSREDQGRVPHWGIDLVEPGNYFSVADFKQYALRKIDEIRSRGHIPFLVGGTGLYVDSIIFDYSFGLKADDKLREQLNTWSLEELYDYCHINNIKLPENKKNKRYVIRAIEQGNYIKKRRAQLINNCVVVGISTDRVILRRRIEDRARMLFHDGVVQEATLLGKQYGWDNEAMKGNVYRLVHLYLRGEETLSSIREKFTTLDWRLAKRQLTWLRRNQYIQWYNLDQAYEYLEHMLARGQRT